MIEIVKSLYEKGLVLMKSTAIIAAARGLWFLDISDGTLTEQRKFSVELPVQRKRGADAYKKPHYTYDKASNLVDPGAAFWKMTHDILEADPEALEALDAYLRKPTPLASVKPQDWVVLVMGGKPLAHRPKIKDWCEDAFRRSISDDEVSDGGQGTCLVTGNQGPLVQTHDFFKGVGGSSGKFKLCSVNERAMQYRGREQAANFPLCPRVNTAYTQALTHSLIENGVHLIWGKGANKEASCSVAFWSEGAGSHPILALVRGLMGFTKSEDAESLWAQVEALSADDPAPIHALMLRAAMGRTSVRGYQVLSAGGLRQNLLKFRDEFSRWKVPTFRGVVFRNKDDAPPPSRSAVYGAAWAIVTGTPYPGTTSSLLYRAHLDKPQDRARVCAWLDATHNRKYPKKPPMETASTNPQEHHDATDIPPESSDKGNPSAKDAKLPDPNRYIDLDLNDDVAYRFGRTVAAGLHLRSSYHRGRVHDNHGSELRRSLLRPGGYFNAGNKTSFYIQKLMEKNWDMTFVNLYNKLMAELGRVPSRFSLEAQQIATQGFLHQDLGCTEYTTVRWPRKIKANDKKPDSGKEPDSKEKSAA